MPRDLANPAPDIEIRELTCAMSRGCEESWASFYESYHRRLRGYLIVCWKGEAEAIDDLLQETLFRVVKHIRVFDTGEVFWSWLTVLAKSAVSDHGRKAVRFRRFLNAFIPEKTVSIPSDQILKEARKELSKNDQELLKWKYEECRTVSQIAAELRISPKAVESRLTRARSALRKIYRKTQ